MEMGRAMPEECVAGSPPQVQQPLALGSRCRCRHGKWLPNIFRVFTILSEPQVPGVLVQKI